MRSRLGAALRLPGGSGRSRHALLCKPLPEGCDALDHPLLVEHELVHAVHLADLACGGRAVRVRQQVGAHGVPVRDHGVVVSVRDDVILRQKGAGGVRMNIGTLQTR